MERALHFAIDNDALIIANFTLGTRATEAK